jgi:hypothetical protein
VLDSFTLPNNYDSSRSTGLVAQLRSADGLVISTSVLGCPIESNTNDKTIIHDLAADALGEAKSFREEGT